MTKPRVLIVDDEPSVLTLLEMAFAQRSWDLATAETGEAALASFKATRPDVVLADKNLPGISGVDLIREIRKSNEDLGIILMTGYASAESAQETLNLGIDEYVQKPFEDVMLLAGLIERVIARSRARTVPVPAPVPTARKMHILIMSTDAERQPRIAAALSSNDRVEHASSADELWTMLSQGQFDMVIVDGASMRGEAGQLTTTLRRRFPDIPVVVLSKRLTLSEIQQLIQLQVRGLVDHTLDAPAFASTLSQLTERVRRLRR
jgi:DNA-binding NtrC family response regulator